jgi:hypothetical protein
MKKNVNIYIPVGKSTYYANFRIKQADPKNPTIIRPVQINRSTGTDHRPTAQSIANHMRNQALLGLFKDVPKLRDECPTAGQLVDRFLERSGLGTAQQLTNEFLTVVAEGAGMKRIKGNDRAAIKAQRSAARDLRLSVLTADHMLLFRDGPDQHRTVITINKLMRTAFSMFSKRAMEYYRGLNVPDVSKWLTVALLPETEDVAFVPIPITTLISMDADAPSMLELAGNTSLDESSRAKWLNAYGCYWMMRRCGLRNDEVSELRWEWFQQVEGNMRLYLNNYGYWEPKGSPGFVPVAWDLYNQLLELFGPAVPGQEGFVLKGTPNIRWRSTHVNVNEFVRKYLPDRKKGAYELRKQWGSEIASEHGLETASQLLRHSDFSVTYKHYFASLKLGSIKAR